MDWCQCRYCLCLRIVLTYWCYWYRDFENVGCFRVVKFISAYLSAFFLIDVIGRKRALYTGLSLQMTCILYYAIFLTIVPQAAEEGVDLVDRKESCSRCIGCYLLSGTGWTMGFNSVQYLIGAEIFPWVFVLCTIIGDGVTFC